MHFIANIKRSVAIIILSPYFLLSLHPYIHTRDNVELRMSRNGGINNSDLIIYLMKIYVK